MKTSSYTQILCIASLVTTGLLGHAVERYVSPEGSHVPPFTNWADAATNIQDAIDVASAGDVVWVTNGVYATGGKVMAGDLTNRVVLDKALTVQSVNGPEVTIVQGKWDPATTTGPLAARCAWLTNGATLSGFTLRDGATRSNGDSTNLMSGGGVWCVSTNAVLTNCWVTSNFASSHGGGAYNGKLTSCVLSNNSAGAYGGGAAYSTVNRCILAQNSGSSGGGAAYGILGNCRIIGNSASFGGGGVYFSTLSNCLLKSNTCFNLGSGAFQNCVLDHCTVTGNKGDYAVRFVTVKNSIINGNGLNYSFGTTISYSCASPLPSGTGNINSDPQLLSDGIHLAATSPCRGLAATNSALDTDIDGQPCGDPPSMGCDQWGPAPIFVGFSGPEVTRTPGQLAFKLSVVGQEPFLGSWSKDGTAVVEGPHYEGAKTTKLLINHFGPQDVGSYQVVASNGYGNVTSTVISVITVHCVDINGSNPIAPYSSWSTAATNIQGAIEVSSTDDVIVVSNGTYAVGGKSMDGVLTNRVAVDRPVTVLSANGVDATSIQGQWHPGTTNGASGIRCVWLTNGAVLSGFTLTGGATRALPPEGGGVADYYRGGGVFALEGGEIANSLITENAADFGGGISGGIGQNCVISSNIAFWDGGGAYYGVLKNCLVEGNASRTTGSGAFESGLVNSVIRGNQTAFGDGAAIKFSSLPGSSRGGLTNCTVVGNVGGGVRSVGALPGSVLNSIVYFNVPFNIAGPSSNTCATPLAGAGSGNISENPELVDGFHLASTSPCRGMGAPIFANGVDFDGDPWASPPSMGADEVWDADLVGPLTVAIEVPMNSIAQRTALGLAGEITGRASYLAWDFGDGTISSNLSYLTSHTWPELGDYTVTFTAYNTDHPDGVSTNVVIQVVPVETPLLTPVGWSSDDFSLQFTSQFGVGYVVERTTNLAPPITWVTEEAVTGSGGLEQVTDYTATNAMRFYRIRIP